MRTGRTRGFLIRFSAAVARLRDDYYGTASPHDCMRVIIGLIVVRAQPGCRTNKCVSECHQHTLFRFPASPRPSGVKATGYRSTKQRSTGSDLSVHGKDHAVDGRTRREHTVMAAKRA